MNEMEVCPYNRSHIIIRSRMPQHLTKCAKNYRGPPLVDCPFNFMHKVTDLKDHFETCEDYHINYTPS